MRASLSSSVACGTALALLLLRPAPALAGAPSIPALPMVASPAIAPRTLAVHAAAAPQLGPDSLPAPVAAELLRAAPYPTAEVRGSRFRAAGSCSTESAELTAPLVASGRASLRISGHSPAGRPCQAYAFVDVRVTAEALVATRPIREGERLEGSVRLVRRELVGAERPLTELPDGVLASRSLATGQLLEQEVLRPRGLNPGTPVRVLVRTGALSLEETGRVTRCTDQRDPAHACALVDSGKRVEGTYHDGAILVETP